MPVARGRMMPLSLPRRTICDLTHFAKKVPSVPVERRMRLAPVAALRNAASPRPSWCAVFMKAHARMAAAMPEFRRAYLAAFRSRLYEHPFSIASVALEREYHGEKGVFFAHFRRPEDQPLAQIDAKLKSYLERGVENVALFRRSLQIARYPRFLRRFLWWMALNWSGPKRAHRLGTFGVSVYSSLGAESLHPLSPLTSTLNYGVVEPDGSVNVRIVYDHRVMDGAAVARGLALMEQILHGDIAEELRGMAEARAA